MSSLRGYRFWRRSSKDVHVVSHRNDNSSADGQPEDESERREEPELCTAEEAVEKIGCGLFQVLLISFAGSLWAVEAFEVLLLSMLSARLTCVWGLSSFEEALLTSMVFVGFQLGSPFWGYVADRYGRKRTLVIVASSSATFGLLSAFSPSYGWMVFLRTMLGIAAAGDNQGITLCVEYLPRKSRAVAIMLLSFYWVLGALGVVGLGWAVAMLQWRWLVGLASVPFITVACISPIVPKSARFLVLNGRKEAALRSLNIAARLNCRPKLNVTLVTDEEMKELLERKELEGVQPSSEASNQDVLETVGASEEDTSELELTAKQLFGGIMTCFKDLTVYQLFKDGMWKTTILLFLIWVLVVGYYFGIVLITTVIFQYDKHCSLSSCPEVEVCKDLTFDDYSALMWTTVAEAPGTLITIFIMPFFGRKIVMAVEMVIIVIFTALLFVCTERSVLIVFIFICRGLISAVYQVLFVYTPEVYPTNIRALGLGVCTTAGRIGAITSPFIAQVLFQASDIAGILCYVLMAAVCTLFIVLLPIETKGKVLKEL